MVKTGKVKQLSLKVSLPEVKDEPELPKIELDVILENLASRLFAAETRLESLYAWLIEENIVSKAKLQKIVRITESHRELQRLEGLSNEETYKRRSKAYKEVFKK